MPLSEREQRLLDQIERALSVEDPKLTSALRGPYRHKPSRLRFIEGVAVFASGLVLLVLGVGITSLSSTAGSLWLSAIGFLLMLGGKPHRHWFSGRLDGRPRRPFEQE